MPESDSDQDLAAQSKSSKSSSRSRRRANTTSSDGLLAFDAQGHHKPTYKHPKPSQKCGPYQLHRGNSLHSTSSTGDRSVDGLVQSGSANDSSAAGSPGSSGSYDGLSMPRRIRSEATSPLMTGSSFSQLNGQLPPLDLSAIKYPPYEPNSADFFGNISDYDVPLFSAGASVDWSHYEGLDFGRKAEDFAPSNYSQAQSYGGYEYAASEQVPTLTTNTSTSGEVSEGEDILANPLDDLTAQYRNPTANSSYDMSYGHTGLQGTGELSLDFEDYLFMKSAPKFLAGRAPLTDEPALLGATLGYVGYTPPDHEAFWTEFPHGLPTYTTESPTTDNNLATYWDDQ